MYTVGYHTCTLHVYLTSTAAHGGRSVGRYVCKYRIMCDVPCKYLQLAECKRQAIHSCQSWPGRQRWKSNLFPADGWSVTGVRTCSKFKGKSRKEKGKGKKRKKEKGKIKTPLIPHRQCNVIHVKVQTFFVSGIPVDIETFQDETIRFNLPMLHYFRRSWLWRKPWLVT